MLALLPLVYSVAADSPSSMMQHSYRDSGNDGGGGGGGGGGGRGPPAVINVFSQVEETSLRAALMEAIIEVRPQHGLAL